MAEEVLECLRRLQVADTESNRKRQQVGAPRSRGDWFVRTIETP